MTDLQFLLVDEPAPHVRRITLNRPEKRNAISTPLRRFLMTLLCITSSSQTKPAAANSERRPSCGVQIFLGGELPRLHHTYTTHTHTHTHTHHNTPQHTQDTHHNTHREKQNAHL